MKQELDIDALSEKQLLLLEKLLQKMGKSAKPRRQSGRKTRRDMKKRFNPLKPHPSDVMRCIAFERAQGNPNAQSDGYKRAKIEMVERIKESERRLRRLHNNLAEGRLNHGIKNMKNRWIGTKQLDVKI